MSNYGFIDEKTILKQAVRVCDCLGHGENRTAVQMIVETAIVESGLGKIEDKTIKAGIGITQFDEIPFYDVRERNMKRKNKILNDLGVDIALVEWEHLRYNSFLALLFTRLFYLLLPEQIPSDLEGRARYWKKYYNTSLGKGDVEHYLRMNEIYGIEYSSWLVA